MEMHTYQRVSSDSPETSQKLYIFTKFPHQEIRWNFGILRSVFSKKSSIIDVWQASKYAPASISN